MFGGPDAGLTPAAKAKFAVLIFDLSNRAASLRKEPATEALLQLSGLGPQLNPANLDAILAIIRTNTSLFAARDSAGDRYRIWSLYYSIRSLLGLNRVMNELLVLPRVTPTVPNDVLIAFDLIDYDDTGVSVTRVREALKHLSTLVEALSAYTGEAGDFRVQYADSGSNIVLGLLAMPGVTTLLIGLFRETVAYLKNRNKNNLARHLPTMRDALSFINEVETSPIDPEAKARLQNIVLTEIAGLMEGGVKLHIETPPMVQSDTELLASVRGTKLLGPGPNTDDPE